MDASKDYYAILGVLPSIEPTALKAVYLALVKKYHPDVFKGSKIEAERITKQLNEAYGVLGDQTKRAEYDALRKTKTSDGGDFSQENTSEGNDYIDAELENDWKFVVEYYPESEKYRKELHDISKSLSVIFQHIILTEKLSDKSAKIADLLKNEYMIFYFGSNKILQNFALKMLHEKKRHIALELNNIIRVLGTPNDDKILPLINKLLNKFGENPNYRLQIESLFLNASFEQDKKGEYFALMKNKTIIGSLDNNKYYIFNNMDHFKSHLNSKDHYISVSGAYLIEKFCKKLDMQVYIDVYNK